MDASVSTMIFAIFVVAIIYRCPVPEGERFKAPGSLSFRSGLLGASSAKAVRLQFHPWDALGIAPDTVIFLVPT